jgi:hypothetical protein
MPNQFVKVRSVTNFPKRGAKKHNLIYLGAMVRSPRSAIKIETDRFMKNPELRTLPTEP